MNKIYMLKSLLGENDIAKIENDNGEVLKTVGKDFAYYNRELIFESKNELLIEELKGLSD